MGRSIRDIEILGPVAGEYAKGIRCGLNSQVLGCLLHSDAMILVSIAFYKSSSLDECNEKCFES